MQIKYDRKVTNEIYLNVKLKTVDNLKNLLKKFIGKNLPRHKNS